MSLEEKYDQISDEFYIRDLSQVDPDKEFNAAKGAQQIVVSGFEAQVFFTANEKIYEAYSGAVAYEYIPVNLDFFTRDLRRSLKSAALEYQDILGGTLEENYELAFDDNVSERIKLYGLSPRYGEKL
jgi:hypothetical protein